MSSTKAVPGGFWRLCRCFSKVSRFSPVSIPPGKEYSSTVYPLSRIIGATQRMLLAPIRTRCVMFSLTLHGSLGSLTVFKPGLQLMPRLLRSASSRVWSSSPVALASSPEDSTRRGLVFRKRCAVSSAPSARLMGNTTVR